MRHRHVAAVGEDDLAVVRLRAALEEQAELLAVGMPIRHLHHLVLAASHDAAILQRVAEPAEVRRVCVDGGRLRKPADGAARAREVDAGRQPLLLLPRLRMDRERLFHEAVDDRRRVLLESDDPAAGGRGNEHADARRGAEPASAAAVAPPAVQHLQNTLRQGLRDDRPVEPPDLPVLLDIRVDALGFRRVLAQECLDRALPLRIGIEEPVGIAEQVDLGDRVSDLLRGHFTLRSSTAPLCRMFAVRSVSLARDSRDRTVPTGTERMSAASS